MIEQLFTFVSQHTNSIGLKIPELPGVMSAPTVATIREISLGTDRNRVNFKYTQAAYTVDLNMVGGINVVLASLANGAFAMSDDPLPKPPYNSQLSLNNDRYIFIILKIANDNLQFSHDKDPFSLSLEAFYPQVYYKPRRVDGQGATVEPGLVRHGCKIAYLIADGPAARGATPGPYIDPFNLHLDLLDKDSNGQDSVIPVIVDPDVRYPGGSGP